MSIDYQKHIEYLNDIERRIKINEFFVLVAYQAGNYSDHNLYSALSNMNPKIDYRDTTVCDQIIEFRRIELFDSFGRLKD